MQLGTIAAIDRAAPLEGQVVSVDRLSSQV